MERLAKDMVDRCGGLPLAIVVLSGLLSLKRGFKEWQRVKDHLWQHIKDDSIEISYILSLSYNDLPTALKQCFLYFGIIPEDHEVHVDHILWLWRAEGFIPRHLVASYSKPLKRISKLTSLQVLKGIHCDQWKDVDPVDLVNLRELTMHEITKTYSLNNISGLKNLSTLKLCCVAYESFPNLEYLSSCQNLQKLWLEGQIEKLPLSEQFPNSIAMMVLRYSELMEDPMSTLGMLPNLRNLDLFRAYGGKEITCSDNSFSQLEILRLDCLENLERWHLATSAMPLIKGLGIQRCPKLHEIPDRIKDVERTPFQ
ncbi:hypothetical protein KY284_022158 [Solanum tuberosum]|nr:hypothetical protein KY284_022158 [Solanum tuberosum]